MDEKTRPKPRFPEGVNPDPRDLAAGRYGTHEMVQIWGADNTIATQLRVQGEASFVLSCLHPDIVPLIDAREIVDSIELVDPDDVRLYEEQTGHDIIALNRGLADKVSKKAAVHINKARTSGDTTQPARAIQLRDSLEVIAESAENLRDILIEKSLEWQDEPHMDQSHLLDALPTVAGRPFAHYAEMLQSSLGLLGYIYRNSIKGKWSDATGNHHSANALGIDGRSLEDMYCKSLGIGRMIAPAQIPGLEFEADIVYVMARMGETMNNISRYIAWGKGDDVNIFHDTNPKKRKGSSAMPHKDFKGGNPTAEEQLMSVRNWTIGAMATALANCEMAYARTLAASSNSRFNFEYGFKYFDHGIRRLASAVYWLGLNRERAMERINRTFGIITSNRVMAYLTDQRQVRDPMTREEAHDLLGELATKAYESRTAFGEILARDERVASKIDRSELQRLTNPLNYTGESVRIINTVAEAYHKASTLESAKANL